MERRRLHVNNSPMADSTRIDASSLGNRPSLSGFSMTLSPLRRNSVISSSNGSRTPEKSLASQTLATATAAGGSSSRSISRQKLNLSQLDPRTFADVHSSGLTSRLVAYHEKSLGGGSSSGVAGLQRSMSANNLYSPLSQPRRPAGPPLPYKSSVPVLSLTQIAPPERSFYSGNTLSSLMRSNSLVGMALKPSDQEQLLRENRPILHPPHPQHECEPTRSVLEELKEISRKRINSGDTQTAHDFTKRSCQREDFVDLHQHHHHQHQHQHELHRLQQQQQHHQHHQSFKRQRELTVAVPLRHNLTSLPVPPPTLQHMYSNGAISPHQSPEHVAKRRNCSYSNDIASSLSSSLRHSNKRKLFDMRETLQRSHNESAASTSSPETSPKSKVQRKVDADAIVRTQSMPIPAVPAVPPARTISAPPAKSQSSASTVAAEKPKLTLFNARQPSQSTVDRPREDLNSPDVDAGEYAGIQFVKPKQQNSMLGTRNPSVERTQKTKLAIMLSGLKGELYQGEPDEPDSTLLPTPAGLQTPIKPISLSVVATKTITTSIATTTTTTTSTTTTSSTKAPTIVSPSKPVILSNQVIVPAATATTTTLPKLAFGKPNESAPGGTAAAAAPATTLAAVGGPVAATAPTTSSATAAIPTPTAVTTDKAPEGALGMQPKFNLPATPLVPGLTSAQPLLNFGSPKTSTAPTLSFGSTTTSSGANTSSSAPVFSFGQAPATTNGPNVGAATSLKTETTKTSSSTTTISSLAQPSTTSMTFGTATATATVLPNIKSTLSFGQPIAATTTATTSPFGTAPAASSSSMISPPKAAPMFAFGQSSSTANGTATPAEQPPAVFSFGGSSTTTQATNGATASKPMGSTTFGGVFNSKPEQPKPAGIFGSQDNTFGSPFKPPAAAAGAALTTEPANAFAFKTPTTSTATAATNLFSFGGGASAAAKPAEAASNLPFGQSAGAAAATPFSFGGAATAAAKETASNTEVNKSVFAFGGGAGGDKSTNSKPSGVLNFGGADKAAAPPAFGSVAPTAAPATAPTSNAFAFGSSAKPSTPMFGSSGATTATPAATKPFAFGAAQPTPTAAPAATGGFSFAAAAAAKKTEEPSGANLFGSPAAKPSFSFGGNASNQAAGAGAAAVASPASGGFSFGKKDEPAPTNLFGSPASANTGVVKPTFGFGGGSNATPQAAPSTPSTFGGFGAPPAAVAAAPQPQPAAAAAGASNQNKPFAFGGSSASAAPTSAAPNMGGNLFASAVAATQNQAKTGGFAFGGAKNATTNNSTAGNAPFSFGGAAAGGIASPPSNQSMNTAKPFSFGGAGGNPAPTVFGSPAPAPPASNPAGAFNFGGATSPAQQANAGNMFAPPPEGRLIRKATRRLQK